jgi:ABC-2 type transport system permease protein
MNTHSNAMPESLDSHGDDSHKDSQAVVPSILAPTRPFCWSVRRELWENRSIYLAPLAAAALILFVTLIGAFHLPLKLRAAIALDSERQRQSIVMPYEFAAGLFMVVGMIVGFFYCIDALYGERRDRSILFWKSLPVSDATTVLAKASIPLVILPLITVGLTVVTQFVILLLNSAVLSANGMSVATYWAQLSFFQMSLMLFYHLFTVHVLGHAPFYAWFLLVSAWAKRAPFLWAFLPPLAIAFIEKMLFNTSYFANAIVATLSGGTEVVHFPGRMPIEPGTQLTPGHFLLSPGLWIGFAISAIFLFAAVRLRRNREPI